MVDTLLEIDFGIAPESARGINESLQLESGATNQRRTVNGTLRNLASESFRKYLIQLDCNDLQPPAFGNVWPGQIVTVKCITELSYAIGGTPDRDAVSGSVRVRNGFVYYRPQLTAMVDSFDIKTDEWGGRVGWTLKLAEV